MQLCGRKEPETQRVYDNEVGADGSDVATIESLLPAFSSTQRTHESGAVITGEVAWVESMTWVGHELRQRVSEYEIVNVVYWEVLLGCPHHRPHIHILRVNPVAGKLSLAVSRLAG